MSNSIKIYYGEGQGKSAAAFGNLLKAASMGKSVVIIQFLKGTYMEEHNIFQRLEPEVKLFRFEKAEDAFTELSEEAQREEISNIKNALNFAKKVISTGECDLLILDELLGLVDEGVATGEEVAEILSHAHDETEIILTGRVLDSHLRDIATNVCKIEQEK